MKQKSNLFPGFSVVDFAVYFPQFTSYFVTAAFTKASLEKKPGLQANVPPNDLQTPEATVCTTIPYEIVNPIFVAEADITERRFFHWFFLGMN